MFALRKLMPIVPGVCPFMAQEEKQHKWVQISDWEESQGKRNFAI